MKSQTVEVEVLEPRRLFSSSALPQLVLSEATTLDHDSVEVSYTITNADITQPLEFQFYRSSKPTLDRKSTFLGTQAITDSGDLAIGTHNDVEMLDGTTLAPNPKQQYVIAVANAGEAVDEAPGSINTAYFQTFTLGAISHGLELSGDSIPHWEKVMARGLRARDHFNAVIAFNWAQQSRVESSGEAVAAGNTLESMVVDEADELASAHAGDVVNLQFIGHSRGAVVISQAMQDLVGTSDAALQGSYVSAAFLDPHPASPATLNLYSGFSKGQGALYIQAYQTFENIADDPAVVIPSNVDYVRVIYQHTDSTKFRRSSILHYLNPWGEGPADGIVNDSSVAIAWTNLTNVSHGNLGPIGHTQVPRWYLERVVDRGTAAATTQAENRSAPLAFLLKDRSLDGSALDQSAASWNN